MNIMNKSVFTKDDLNKILADKQQEWRFKFLKDFKTNLVLAPDKFETLLNKFIDSILEISGKMPHIETFNNFVSPWIDKKYINENEKYKTIYTQIKMVSK